MSTPPQIRYSGPTIAQDVPWEIRRHLQLIYQKLGNHTQAFALLPKTSKQSQTPAIGGTTSVHSGGTGSQNLPQNAVIIGNGQAPVMSVSPVHGNDVLTDNGPGNTPSFQSPLIYDAVTDGMGSFIFGKVSSTFTADCVTGRYR